MCRMPGLRACAPCCGHTTLVTKLARAMYIVANQTTTTPVDGGVTMKRSPSLGTIARNLSTDSPSGFTRQGLSEEDVERARDNRLLRWALQAEARALLPDERVAECLRAINPLAAGVQVLHSPLHQVAHYKSL